MKPRKWMALAASAACFGLLSISLSFAQEEKKEENMHQLMEKVSASNNKINRLIRTKVTFTKANNGKDIAKEATTLLELTKKARDREDSLANAKEEKEPKKKWLEFMDAQIKGIEDLTAASEAGDFDKAKASHTTIKNTCSECHKVFKVEEDF